MLICAWIKFASLILFKKLADYKMSESAHKNITFVTITDSLPMKTSAEISMLAYNESELIRPEKIQMWNPSGLI